MKLIIAYIQPYKLVAVKQALFEKKIYKLSVTNSLGCGQQAGLVENYRGTPVEMNLLKKVRLEILVSKNFVQSTIDAIIQGAQTGEIGDGKIFVLPVEEAIRIRTGEKGQKAVG